MSKPPKKVDVGPFRYEVMVGPLDGMSGFMNSNEKRIILNDRVTPETAAETLLHEILHAVIDMTGQRGDGKEAEDQEEAWVASISPVLYMVLRSNPRLLAYLAE